jgi:hypothetical protein
MAVLERVGGGAAVLEIRAARQDAGSDEILALLRTAWKAPVGSSVGGCDPCRSGLDRLVLEDPAFRNFGR